MRARKKPVEIDYFPIEFTDENAKAFGKWILSFGINIKEHFILDNEARTVKVKTLEGTSYTVGDTDVIIRGTAGEFYPCKKSIFYETYDLIED